MCSVMFASHCPSKHVSILLYFLIHEFDTHSSTMPKYITLGFPDEEIFQKLFLESVQFSCSVMSDSLRPHESQHARSPCPSPTLGFTQTHVHWVGDAIQPSHPLSPPDPPAPNPSQYQGLFQWVNSSYELAKVLEFQLQHQSFQWIFRTDLLLHVYIHCTIF